MCPFCSRKIHTECSPFPHFFPPLVLGFFIVRVENLYDNRLFRFVRFYVQSCTDLSFWALVQKEHIPQGMMENKEMVWARMVWPLGEPLSNTDYCRCSQVCLWEWALGKRWWFNGSSWEMVAVSQEESAPIDRELGTWFSSLGSASPALSLAHNLYSVNSYSWNEQQMLQEARGIDTEEREQSRPLFHIFFYHN